MIFSTLAMALVFVAFTTVADVLGSWLVARKLQRPSFMRVLTHFAVGSLLGFTFLDLLPQALNGAAAPVILSTTLLGIVGFYMFEHLTASLHCTDLACQTHTTQSPRRQMVVLAGSLFEEFIDGAAIGLAVILGEGSLLLVITTSIAIFFHEVPDSMARTIAFVNAGVSSHRAVRKVLFSTVASFLGAALFVVLSTAFVWLLPYFTALAAAAFIYIALSHLVPQMHFGVQQRTMRLEVMALLGGVFVIALLGLFE